MIEYKCPLCKQSVSEELFEKITGIWKERRAAEKRFKEREKELIKLKKDAQKQLETERKKLKVEQKVIIEQKIATKVKKYNTQLEKIEKEKNRLKERFDKKIAFAVKSAEAKTKRELNKELKSKMEESIQKQVTKATEKTQKNLSRATQTIVATRKQMTTLQKHNEKQQQKIKNLEIQLRNQTTPQLEGLLYEDKLLEVLQKEFTDDNFTHPGKGGDIIQCIFCSGKSCGIIVYECKRVSQWQTAHVEQAATAKMQRKADYAILVTNSAKKGAGGFFVERDVVVVHPGGVLAIAKILREQLLKIAQLQLTHAQREEAVEKTLEYLQGPEFKNSLNLVIRKTVEMYEDLKKECQEHVKNWKKRHDSLKNIYSNTAHVEAKTKTLLAGKTKGEKEITELKPFPALPDLTNIQS